MAEAPLPDRKPRKSVAFSEGATIMDENGNINAAHLEDKTTAESHSTSTDKAVDEVTDLFAGLNKKKKKAPKTKTEDEVAPDADAPAVDAEFDASTLKKKKKKSSKPKPDADFDAKLASAGLEGDDASAAAATNGDAAAEQDGDIDKGTGIWAHNATTPISYALLLTRFFKLVNEYNPDILSSGSKSYKIPPPQCLREGNKKTIFANIADICKRMKRSDEHVTQFLFAELGTSGSTDGSKRLVIKGRFQQKQIENVLRRYIMEYVTCKTCKSGNTELSKGENRLYFITCNSCGSRRSVTAIKSGFTTGVGISRDSSTAKIIHIEAAQPPSRAWYSTCGGESIRAQNYHHHGRHTPRLQGTGSRMRPLAEDVVSKVIFHVVTMSDFSELLRKIAVPQEDIDFFSSQPCAIPYLARRGNDAAATAPFQPIPFVTRHKYHKDDTSDTFFSRTINSNDTIPRMLALFRTKQSNEAEAEASTAANPDLIVFVQLGNGLNGFRDTLHGGALASLFDEVIGLYQGEKDGAEVNDTVLAVAPADPVLQDSDPSATPPLFEPVDTVPLGALGKINAEPHFRSSLVSTLQRYKLNHTRDVKTKQRWAEIQQRESECRQTLLAPSSDTTSGPATKSRQEIFLKNVSAYTEYRSRILGWFDARPNIQDRVNQRSITVEEAKEVCLLFYNVMECGSLLEKEMASQDAGVEHWQAEDGLGCVPLDDAQVADERSIRSPPRPLESVLANIREVLSVDEILEVASRNILLSTHADDRGPEQHGQDMALRFNDPLAFVRAFAVPPSHPSHLERLIHTQPDVRLAILQWLVKIRMQVRNLTDLRRDMTSVAADRGHQFWSKTDLVELSEPNAETITAFMEAVEQRRHIISRFEGWLVDHAARFIPSTSPPHQPVSMTISISVAEARYMLGALSELVDAHAVVLSTVRVQVHLQLHLTLAHYTAATSTPANNTTDHNDRAFIFHQNMFSLARTYTRLLTCLPPDTSTPAAEKRTTMHDYLAACEKLRRVYTGMRLYVALNSEVGTHNSPAAVTPDEVSPQISKQAFLLLDERKDAYKSINTA
ncbi:hypothetical protein DV738_g709, partial [Chaetothyriales sp. CBS 135597]